MLSVGIQLLGMQRRLLYYYSSVWKHLSFLLMIDNTKRYRFASLIIVVVETYCRCMLMIGLYFLKDSNLYQLTLNFTGITVYFFFIVKKELLSHLHFIKGLGKIIILRSYCLTVIASFFSSKIP